jgi:spermidine synthase
VPSGRLVVLIALFFGSGACGLIYQVLWLRQLSLVFGVTVYAASTVLAAFMTGLALGSLAAGPLVARVRRPLATFGAAEVLIGILALSTPALLNAASSLYDAVYRALPDAPGLLTATRFVCAFPVLLGPTILMGLTLPLLGASSLVRGEGVGSRVSALYAANTGGAVAGALLAGYELIGAIGMRRTFLVAAAVNILVGLGAFGLARRTNDHVAAADAPTPGAVAPADARTRRAVARVIAISGAAALALEIVWFRILLQFLHASTYAFTTMLATVLGGIALGGVVGARVLARPRDWHWILVRVLFATGIAVAVSLIFLAWSFDAGWRTSATVQASAAAILPAATLMGVAFPMALRLGAFSPEADPANGRSVALGVGRLYALNVAGAIVGAITGGFVLLPVLGSRLSLVVLASLYVVCGVVLLSAHPRRGDFRARAVQRLVVFGVAAMLVPDPFTATIARRHGEGRLEVWRHEGAQTAVSVQRYGLGRVMFIDGMHQADDSQGTVSLHRVLGLLPVLLHPNPSRVLVVGLGGGTTPGAISLHPEVSVDVVELSESVRRAASQFAHVNYNVLNRPNVRLRVDDGRNFLRLTRERFDVITADVIQPTTAGAGSLYSREYFALVRRALAPGGLALQWIGHRPAEHHKILLRTFLEVFPESTLWYAGNILVGSLRPLRVDPDRVEARLNDATLRTTLDTVGLVSLDTLRSWYTAGPAAVQRQVGRGEILTDDRPLLEYHRSFREGARDPDLGGLNGHADEVFGTSGGP